MADERKSREVNPAKDDAPQASEDSPVEETAPALEQDPKPSEVKVILDPDFETEYDEIAVSVPGLTADEKYTDEHARVVVSKSPTTLPLLVAEALNDHPAVKIVIDD